MMRLFSQVDDHVFRGAAPSLAHLHKLKNEYGIERIISLDGQVARQIANTVRTLGMTHVVLHLGDGSDPRVNDLAEKIVPMMMDGVPTYIHCKHGKDRTGMAVAMYRIANGWSLSSALKEAQEMYMGYGLPPIIHDSYYEAVKEFAEDVSEDEPGDENNLDVAESARMETYIADNVRGASDYSDSEPNRTSFAPFSDDFASTMSIRAYATIYTKTFNPLKVPQFWYDAVEKIPKNTPGRIYKAKVSANSNVSRDWRKPTATAINQLRYEDVDVSIFMNSIYVIFNSDALIDIEDDLDDVNDVPIVGSISAYDGAARYVAPGSGGADMLMSGTMGAAGPVQLPYNF